MGEEHTVQMHSIHKGPTAAAPFTLSLVIIPMSTTGLIYPPYRDSNIYCRFDISSIQGFQYLLQV
jgi:hypothetical protein